MTLALAPRATGARGLVGASRRSASIPRPMAGVPLGLSTSPTRLAASRQAEAQVVAASAVASIMLCGSAEAATEVAGAMLVGSADVANEVAQLAAADSRIASIATLFVPVLGWVIFNAIEPLLKQLDNMDDSRKGGLLVSSGLGAAAYLLLAEEAKAATEVVQMASGYNRLMTIAALFASAVGCVAFNAAQLDKMSDKN